MKKKYRLYSSMPTLSSHKTCAEIDLAALKNNYNIMRDLINSDSKSRTAICVLKADAYGHGAKTCCQALLEEGCRFFAVSSIEEAIDLREVCNDFGADAEILILGYVLPSQAALLARHNIITSLVDIDFARALAKEAEIAGVTVRCHIKLDTGMNRIGFPVRNDAEIALAVDQICEVNLCASIDICGMFTHFAKADEALDEKLPHTPTQVQFERFTKTDSALLRSGVDVKFRHVCNSAAAIRFPEYRLDGCRLGITLYGFYPFESTYQRAILPVMKLCTVISHIHKLIPGESVSYGGTFTCDNERMIATIPIGYADGFIRAYSGAEVSVITTHGIKKARILGRICMDQCMIDVTDTDACVGDKVILFGNTSDELTTLAKMAGTIEYECLSLITSRVPRIVSLS